MKNIFLFMALLGLAACTSITSDTSDLPVVPKAEGLEVEHSPILEIEADQGPTITALKADFTINNSNGEVDENELLLITNLSENAVSYEWDFGNGKTSTEKDPVHTYPIHGPYTVTLKVTDADGNVEITSHEINVLCIFGGGSHDE
jgi:PKD repeat protein